MSLSLQMWLLQPAPFLVWRLLRWALGQQLCRPPYLSTHHPPGSRGSAGLRAGLRRRFCDISGIEGCRPWEVAARGTMNGEPWTNNPIIEKLLYVLFFAFGPLDREEMTLSRLTAPIPLFLPIISPFNTSVVFSRETLLLLTQTKTKNRCTITVYCQKQKNKHQKKKAAGPSGLPAPPYLFRRVIRRGQKPSQKSLIQLDQVQHIWVQYLLANKTKVNGKRATYSSDTLGGLVSIWIIALSVWSLHDHLGTSVSLPTVKNKH